MQTRGPYHLIAASIGLLVAAIGIVFLSGLVTPLVLIAYALAIAAAVVGIIGVVAAGVSIGIRHAHVLEAESFTSPK